MISVEMTTFKKICTKLKFILQLPYSLLKQKLA